MTDTTTDAEPGADTFEARLLLQAQHLRRLRVERGDPSLRKIEKRAREINERTPLPIATLSVAFAGTRFVSVDKVILLVRTLLSWDADGEEISAPSRTDPVLGEWLSRWRATAELRPTRRSTTARASAPERDDPTPTRARTTDSTTVQVPGPRGAAEAEPSQRPKASLAVRAALHAMQAGEMALPPLRAGLVYAVAFSPDGSLLAAGSHDGTVRLWDTTTRTPLGQPLTGHNGLVYTVAFSPDGSLLATGSHDGTVRLWDTTTRTVGQTLTDNLGPVTSVAFSPDGSLLATGSHDGTLRLWDTTTRTPAGPPPSAHSKPVHAVAFSPDGSLLATGSRDGTVRLWDTTTRTPVGRPLTDNHGPTPVVAFSPNGSLLATGHYDHTLGLWDTAAHTPVGQPLTGHSKPVVAVAFSPDGSLLATGSYDQTVRLWDTATRAVGQPLTGHRGRVQAVAFSPDGSLLATGSRDGTVQLWVVPAQAG
ncbi:WD40 repeat domain-containing protein [Streptomyces sp. NPDC047725]|uniref:WD40 repeat domain-containing protein n=1 Tax=Streptomyces sp. NPDC047725 TaxID=3365487 RepID=UPI00370FE9EE